MPEQKTSPKPTVRYTDTGKPEQTDERGKRAVQAKPKDQQKIKADLAKGAGKPLPGSDMPDDVRGASEQAAFDEAHELIATLATSHDLAEHVAAFVDRGKPAAKAAPKKARK